MVFTTKEIRNVAFLGHGGSGKTSLAEAMLFASGSSDRIGKITDGNTVCDYDAEEIKRKFSISLATAPLTWKNIKINLLDTPGFLDFVGEVNEALRVADAAVITVDAKAGIEVGAELSWDYLEERSLPRAFFVNKCDDPQSRFGQVYNELRERFGAKLCPMFVPVAMDGEHLIFVNLLDNAAYTFDEKGSRSDLPMLPEYEEIIEKYKEPFSEALAQTSDELMEKFFSGEALTHEESVNALHEGMIDGSIVPVFCGSATKMWGVRSILDSIADSFPRHTAKKNEEVVVDGEVKPLAIETEGETSVFVFKTVADPFVGKMSYFKVMSGTLTRDTVLKNSANGTEERFAHIYTVRGKKQTEVDTLCCGDIGMIPKIASIATNHTLSASGNITYRPIEFPESNMTKGIAPVAKGDEEKISSGLTKLLEEDLTLKYENNAETKQMLISGIGDMHIDVTVAKLKSRYGTSVVLTEPKIAYRETIKKSVQQEGKHKKQSGGSGQYGHVRITFAPGEAEGLTFTQSVVGGAVPKNYYPAVEKGLEEAMLKGVLAGFPVVNLAADLYDGSYHPVDSNEISFKLAAKLAYKEGLPKAAPVILEPVGELKVHVPESLVGDVMGDLNKRRGRVLGMTPDEHKKGYTVVEAEAPKSEMLDYAIVLRAMTQGRGFYEFRFVRYEEVPSSIAQKIIEEAKKNAEE